MYEPQGATREPERATNHLNGFFEGGGGGGRLRGEGKRCLISYFSQLLKSVSLAITGGHF